VIGYVNLLYLYPRFLSPDQVGLLRTIQDAAILFTPFAQFGIAQSIVKYFPSFANDKKQSGSFISLMLLFALGGFAVFFIAFTVFRDAIASYFEAKAGDFLGYTSLIVWLTLILLMTAVLEAYARSLLKTIIPNLLRDVVIRLMLTFLVIAYYLNLITYDQFILSSVGGYAVCLLLLMAYLWRSGELKLNLNFAVLKSAISGGMVKYSLLGFAGTAGMIIIGKMDSLMVSAMIGLSANAVYTTAFYMATVIEIPKRAFSQITMPLISRAFEKNDVSEINTLYRKTALHQLIIGSLLLLGVAANLDTIFSLMPKSDVYEAGYYVVIIIGVAKLTDMLFGPSSEIIVLSKYYAFNIVLILLLAAMTVSMNALFIPAYGIEGAAYGAAIALIAFNVIKFVFIWVRLGLQPFTTAYVKVILIAALTWTAHLILPRFPNVFLDLAVRSSLMTAIFGGLVYWSGISVEGNGIVKKILRIRELRIKN
jgi:O-antigen/teichoic acid export membrane protein